MTELDEFTIRFADGSTLALGSTTRVMGIINVTPDSFSDGGNLADEQAAIDAGVAMVEAGADFIDIGGESTKPGADAVAADEELQRVIPIVEGLRRRVDARLSIDTRKAVVARLALEAGADMINDVSGLRDPEMLPLLLSSGVPAVLMHMRGIPSTMQRDTNYASVVDDVARHLEDLVGSAIAAGVPGDKIIVDPGIGFGKSAEGSLKLINQLPALQRLGQPILVGASRKSFIGAALDLPVQERLEGSLATAAIAAARGAHMIRAHDVAATVRVVRMVDAICNS